MFQGFLILVLNTFSNYLMNKIEAIEAPPIKEEYFAIRNYHREYDYNPSYTVRYPNEKFISKNSHKRTNIRKKR